MTQIDIQKPQGANVPQPKPKSGGWLTAALAAAALFVGVVIGNQMGGGSPPEEEGELNGPLPRKKLKGAGANRRRARLSS